MEVVDGRQRPGQSVDGPAVQGQDPPVGGLGHGQDGDVGVHLGVAGAAGAMVERRGHDPAHLLLADPVAAPSHVGAVTFQHGHRRPDAPWWAWRTAR